MFRGGKTFCSQQHNALSSCCSEPTRSVLIRSCVAVSHSARVLCRALRKSSAYSLGSAGSVPVSCRWLGWTGDSQCFKLRLLMSLRLRGPY